MQTLYEKDFCAWGKQQAELLMNKQFDKLDLENLIEEVNSVGVSEKRSLVSHLACLLMHLLKMKYHAEDYCRSWEISVIHSKNGFNDVLEENPSIKSKMDEIFEKAYKIAVRDACTETGKHKSAFPTSCPWSLETALNWKQFKYGH